MESVINRLQIDLGILTNNEAVARDEGRTEEADQKMQEIAEIMEAIDLLSHAAPVSTTEYLEERASRDLLEAVVRREIGPAEYKIMLEARLLRQQNSL